MSPCLPGETHRNKSSQNSSQVCSEALLSAGCSGTMTSILLDISVEIRIFLKKDISRSNGLRLISLSRSNRVSLMFGYAGMKVAGLEMCWRIAILPVLFSRWTSCTLVHFGALIQAVYYYRIQSKVYHLLEKYQSKKGADFIEGRLSPLPVFPLTVHFCSSSYGHKV